MRQDGACQCRESDTVRGSKDRGVAPRMGVSPGPFSWPPRNPSSPLTFAVPRGCGGSEPVNYVSPCEPTRTGFGAGVRGKYEHSSAGPAQASRGCCFIAPRRPHGEGRVHHGRHEEHHTPPPREMQDDPVTYQPPRRSHSVARRRSSSSMAALTSGVMGAQPARAVVRISTAVTRAMAFIQSWVRPLPLPTPPRLGLLHGLPRVDHEGDAKPQQAQIPARSDDAVATNEQGTATRTRMVPRPSHALSVLLGPRNSATPRARCCSRCTPARFIPNRTRRDGSSLFARMAETKSAASDTGNSPAGDQRAA